MELVQQRKIQWINQIKRLREDRRVFQWNRNNCLIWLEIRYQIVMDSNIVNKRDKGKGFRWLKD